MFTFIAFVAIFLAIINLAVNVSVLTVTVTSRRLRGDAVTRIISSLAVSDLGFGTFIPFVCAMLAFAQPKPIPVGLERVLGTCYQIFGICSLLHLSFVAIVKCSVIAKPLLYFIVFTDRVIVVTLLGIWLASVVLGSMPAFVGAQFRFEPEVCLPSTVTYGVIQSSIMATCFVVSATVVVVLYAKVFLVVRRHLCAILGVVPSGCVAEKPEIAGRKDPERGAVSAREMVPVDEVVLAGGTVSVESTVPAEALVVVQRKVVVKRTVFATRTAPVMCMIEQERVLSEGGTVKEGTSPVGELSTKADPSGVNEDVATTGAITRRKISGERKMVSIVEKENISGHISRGIVVETNAGAGHPLEVVQRDNCNSEAVEFVKGEQSAAEFAQRTAGDMVSREAAPIKANTRQATHEQRTSGEPTVKKVSFAASTAAAPIAQTSAFGHSIRSAKNLFIMSGVYLITYIPALLTIMKFMYVPPEVRLPLKIGSKWTHISASTFNGLLYIVLHRSVRAELVRLLCRRKHYVASELSTVSRTAKM